MYQNYNEIFKYNRKLSNNVCVKIGNSLDMNEMLVSK